MAIQRSTDEPDEERVEALYGRTVRSGLLQTVLMLAMVGMRLGLEG